jgi:hypothetical protein
MGDVTDRIAALVTAVGAMLYFALRILGVM